MRDLTRPDERWIGGVCSGLSVALRTNVAVFRTLFVIFTPLGFAPVALYLLLWIIAPSDKTPKFKARERRYIIQFTGFVLGGALGAFVGWCWGNFGQIDPALDGDSQGWLFLSRMFIAIHLGMLVGFLAGRFIALKRAGLRKQKSEL